jgi:hypothetical protein
MKLDEKKLYQMMSEFHTLGDEEYGGQGTFQEAVLVGYVYGVLSENRYSELKYDDLDRKVFSFGGFNYVVWFDEIIAGEEEEQEHPLGELEIRIENAPQDDVPEDEEEPILIPIAIEGPYSDDDIKSFLESGDL